MIYDERVVEAHYDKTLDLIPVPVLLVNEAPGPQEAENGIPLIGAQGGNLYRMLVASNIQWVKEWYKEHPGFKWPIKAKNEYSVNNKRAELMHSWREDFLKTRACHIACTNSYPQWPKPKSPSNSFVAPRDEDVIGHENLSRLRTEVQRIRPSILLICGRSAYLACVGEVISRPSEYEGQEVNAQIAEKIRQRMDYDYFDAVWYLGHTRRWFLKSAEIRDVFTSIGKTLGW